LPQIEKEYIATGKVKYVFRDFPIERLHSEAFKAARAAHCAGEQNKYWEMHARLFTHQKALKEKDWSGHARTLGLDLGKFQECLDSEKYTDEIRKDTKPNAPAITATLMVRGAQPYALFKEAIESLLSPKE
jgi:protein-disulfide isomerase